MERRAFLTALGTAGALAGGAWALPMPDPVRAGDIVRVPYDALNFDIDPRFIAGVSRPSRVVSNAQGLRGNLMGSRPHDVLLIGGSTSQCLLLDDRDSVDARLEQRLRAGGLADAAVANAGFAGHPAERLLPELDSLMSRRDRWPSMVIGLFGANEAEVVTNHAPWVESAGVRYDLEGPFGPRQRAKTYAGWYRPGNHGAFIEAVRAAYAAAEKVDELPAQTWRFINARGTAYVEALEGLVARCSSAGIDLVLATQPINFDPKEGPEAALARGWAPFFFAPPGFGFLPTPRVMKALVESFNEITRSVARRRRVPLLELGPALSGDPACFYDQWHFTVHGADHAAGLLAEAVADRLAQRS